MDRRKTTSTRLTPETRKRLERSAANSGRSLAQEIELRIASSFESEKRAKEIAARSAGAIYAQFGRPEVFQIMALLADAIRILERRSGGNCLSDPALFEEVKVTLNTVLGAFGPKQDKDRVGLLRSSLMEQQAQHLGKEAAAEAIKAWTDSMAVVDALGRKGTEKRHSTESTKG